MTLGVTLGTSLTTYVEPVDTRTVFTIVSDGVPAVIVPAAPEGYVHFVTFVRVQNQHATTNSSVSVSDATGIQGFNTAITPNTNGGSTVLISIPALVTATAITANVTGGGPVAFTGFYARVPLVTPQRTIVPFSLAVTGSYQALPQLVPPAGYVANEWGMGQIAGASVGFQSQSAAILGYANRETAATGTIDFKLTRGANIVEMRSSAMASNTRSVVGNQYIPPLLPGDIFEVKANTPVPGAGLCIIMGVFEWVRAPVG
jgi:hypothetical protein